MVRDCATLSQHPFLLIQVYSFLQNYRQNNFSPQTSPASWELKTDYHFGLEVSALLQMAETKEFYVMSLAKTCYNVI